MPELSQAGIVRCRWVEGRIFDFHWPLVSIHAAGASASHSHVVTGTVRPWFRRVGRSSCGRQLSYSTPPTATRFHAIPYSPRQRGSPTHACLRLNLDSRGEQGTRANHHHDYPGSKVSPPSEGLLIGQNFARLRNAEQEGTEKAEALPSLRGIGAAFPMQGSVIFALYFRLEALSHQVIPRLHMAG